MFPSAKIKAHSLTGRITQPLLQAAFQAVKANRGAAGIDKVSVQMFQHNLAENLSALERDLKDGSFRPLPLRRKFILKEPGQFRPLGIPAVRDRIAQERPISRPTQKVIPFWGLCCRVVRGECGPSHSGNSKTRCGH